VISTSVASEVSSLRDRLNMNTITTLQSIRKKHQGHQ